MTGNFQETPKGLGLWGGVEDEPMCNKGGGVFPGGFFFGKEPQSQGLRWTSAAGVPDSVQKVAAKAHRNFVIVPTSQSMRLLLAEQLQGV